MSATQQEPASPRQLARERSRENILLTATTLFAEQGYENTSIRNIAAAAGISLGLMYNYFDGKESMLKEIFRQGMENALQAAIPNRQQSPHTDPLLDLRQVILQLWENFSAHRQFWQLYHSLSHQPATAALLQKELAAWQSALLKEMSAIFSAAGAIHPLAEAHILLSTLEGAGQKIARAEAHYPAAEIRSALLDKYN